MLLLMLMGPYIPKSAFCTTVRLRIGADVVPAGHICVCCGVAMGADGKHALRCAPGPATRGHNRIRDVILGLASLGDGCSVAEAKGLIADAPGLRPADVLSSAAHGRAVAYDVGIACPASSTAAKRAL